MKIALIDGHLIFTQALKATLLNSLPTIESIDTYTSIEHFTSSRDDNAPDIVITELCFNGKYDKGVDLIFPGSENTRVIILTSIHDDWLIRSYMKLGAKAFLTKTCLSEELFAAIAQVQKGKLFLSEDVQNILSAGITTGRASVDYLSSIERSILEAFSRDEPFKTIANNLNISMIELKYHRRMLMERFDVKHFVSLVEVAKKSGVVSGEARKNKVSISGRGGKPVTRFPYKEPAILL